ncbi:MAG: YceI family protein [Bdellovibrionales bacterium]|nr:YceI family protein [Bdellovibrionales bacterium]
MLVSQIFFGSLLLASVPLFSQADQIYRVVQDGAKTGVAFQVAYTAGVHSGVAWAADAEVVLNDAGQVVKANFKVPLSSMTTGNITRDCHMREALGINYSGSKFPAEHVCDSSNAMPQSGPDSVAFPEISFQFSSVKTPPNDPPLNGLEVGKAYNTLVSGTWSMHGVKKTFENAAAIPIQVKLVDPTTREIRLTGQLGLSLKEFNVVVKPFTLGPFKVTVSDVTKVSLNLRLLPSK